NIQIGALNPQMDEEGTDIYPMPKSGMAERGRRVYAANGCIYCHSQQLRPDYASSDIDRKWGERRSAPRDYLFDRPVLLGQERMGPDLSNVGKRAPSEEEKPAASPAANAPAAPPAPAQSAANAAPAKSAQPPAAALPLKGNEAPPPGWEIVPSYDAKCLVAYLMSLDQSHPLKEVKSAGGAPPPAGSPAAAPPAGSPPPAPPAGSPPPAPPKR